MNVLLLLVTLNVALVITAQNCDCRANFEWVKQTFEENDAGFTYAIEQKGEEAYKAHNEAFVKKIDAAESSIECTRLLYQWLTFFRHGHIAIRRLHHDQPNADKSDEEIRESYKDWPKLEVDIKAFKKSLSRRGDSGYEGIWVTDPYEIVIKKVEEEYVGAVLKADGVYWVENQIKLRIKSDNSAVFYMKNHSATQIEKVTMIGKNYLQMGSFVLKRVYPKQKTDSQIEEYFEGLETSKPSFRKIDENTVVLRIPSFSGMRKAAIDKVIDKNWKTLLQTPNLIIDLRGNGGGSDVSFQKLLPLIYTNKVEVYGVEFLSTELNNQRMLDFINDPKYGMSEEGKKWAQESYDILSDHMGEFFNLDSVVVDHYSFDTVYNYPKNVGIIIDEQNASTTEQFLLAARQSDKVTLYGATTMGVLDISNMYFVKSPCEEFELGYCLSRSLRIPEKAIDGIGVQPDVIIEENVPRYKWVNHVVELLGQ